MARVKEVRNRGQRVHQRQSSRSCIVQNTRSARGTFLAPSTVAYRSNTLQGKHKTKGRKIAHKVIEDELTQTDDFDERIEDNEELLASEDTTYVDSESTIEKDWSSKSSSEASDGEDSSESF